ncbi:MAG: alanyl-tRNA editing protein [Candidatus Zixiibacteriota bacterium]
MTERLYYRNAALLEFEAEIVDRGPYGEKYFTVLNRSAFYPTSGGQLFDTGFINDIAVIEVIESENGDVRHITTEPVGEIGAKVTGRIDKVRRQLNRQIHTAQHILSQAFIRLYGCESVSVHLGEEYANIELNAENLRPEQLLEAENLANEIIRDNLPVDIVFADEDLLKYLPLRKIPERMGTLRVIKIADFDCSACGGTHCNFTAEVGCIKIIGYEKVRGRASVKFLSGNLAFEDYRRRFEVSDKLSRELTCHVSDLPDKINKLTLENKNAGREIARLQKELLPIRAEKLAALAKTMGKLKLCDRIIDDLDSSLVGQLATVTADKIGGAAILLAGDRLFLAVADNTGLKAGDLIKEFAAHTGLRGGGGLKLAQVGGVKAEHFEKYRDVILKIADV